MPYLPKDRVVPAMKACRKCGEEKLASEFTPARQNKDGLHSYCRPCYNERQRGRRAAASDEARQQRRDRDNAWHHATKDHRARTIKNRRLVVRYGITLDDYERMLEWQRGCCAICGEEKELVVDHDHVTGEVRGLLCRGCNFQLGFVEQPGWLVKALSYLGGDQ